jgi:hypothetical protein
MEAHRQGDEREKDTVVVPAPGSIGYGMARQCPRGRSCCKSRVDASVTPTNSTTSTAPGDDGTGDARASTAPGQSREHARGDGGVARSSEAILLQIQSGGDLEKEEGVDESTRTY